MANHVRRREGGASYLFAVVTHRRRNVFEQARPLRGLWRGICVRAPSSVLRYVGRRALACRIVSVYFVVRCNGSGRDSAGGCEDIAARAKRDGKRSSIDMPITLNDLELRVLGVLIEKSLAQPAGYPLTLNAVLLGANQKQNRAPVLDVTEAEVATALHTLAQKQLVAHATPAPGARANRFKHQVLEVFHWDRREQAVMAELILRGPQTSGELRTRGCRMTPIPDLEAVAGILRSLAGGDPPFVEELPREPGRSANRFRHLLSAEKADETTVAGAVRSVTDSPSARGPEEESLAARVAKLEDQVAGLTEAVAKLRRNRGETIDDPDHPVV